MFPKTVSILLAILATSYAQDAGFCGCQAQAQPVVIQLSCGNAGQAHPQPPPPADNSAQQPWEGHVGPTEWNMQFDRDRDYCTFDAYGVPDSPVLSFPPGFSIDPETYNAIVPPGYPEPSKSWNGYPSSLGFPMPSKGTEHYNMLLCYPYNYDEQVEQRVTHPPP